MMYWYTRVLPVLLEYWGFAMIMDPPMLVCTIPVPKIGGALEAFWMLGCLPMGWSVAWASTRPYGTSTGSNTNKFDHMVLHVVLVLTRTN